MPNPLIAPLVIAAGSAWIGSYFQDRTKKIAAERLQRQSELDQAGTIYTEVSCTLDTLRFYMMDEAIFVVRRKAKGDTTAESQDEATWAAYAKAVATWKTAQNRLLAQTEVYYGKRVFELLKEIGEILEKGEDQLEATYYGTANSLVKKNAKGTGFNDNSKKFFGTVSPLPEKIRELNRKMMMMRQKQQVGTLRG